MEYIFLQGNQPAVPVKQKCTARGQVRHSVKNTIFIWGRLSRRKTHIKSSRRQRWYGRQLEQQQTIRSAYGKPKPEHHVKWKNLYLSCGCIDSFAG